MKKETNYITFQVDNQRFAMPLNVIERVVQVVEIRPLPKMPDFLHGIINIHGEVIPVINIHFLFGYPKKEIELSDNLIIAKFSSNKIAILVDTIQDIIKLNEGEFSESDKIMYGKKPVRGIIKLDDGMVLINDIDKILNSEKLKNLEDALKKMVHKTKKTA